MIVIYTDGACSGNPGPGGWGAVVLSNDQPIAELHGGEKMTTNNRMELSGVIEALRTQSTDQPITITTDSVYVKEGINSWINNWKRNGWRTSQKQPVKNKDLWQALDEQKARHDAHHKITWRWVKGHAGNRWNERADELARLGVSEAQKTL